MISILVVEDNGPKMDNIKKVISEIANIKPDDIYTASSVKEAKRLLYDNYFDLMILDLVLPVEKGEEAEDKNGAEFLETIHTSPMIKPPTHIIGLTGFTDKISKFDDIFNKRLWHLIDYKADTASWQDQLTSIIYHLIKVRQVYVRQSIRQRFFDVAIITALPSPELEAILRLNNGKWDKFKVEDDITQYYTAVFAKDGKSRSIIAATADQMGMTAASHLSTKMILYFKPQYLIMAGIVAGIKDRGLGFGDILIAEQSWDYGSGKIVEEKNTNNQITDIFFEPETRDIQLNAELKAKISSFKLSNQEILSQIQNEWPSDSPDTKLKVHMGPIGSGSYVISSKETLESIKLHQRKLLGVEMETFGVYYSAEHSANPVTKAISIKSVTDYGDGKKNDKYQKYAAYTSASFIYHFILSEL